MLYLLGHFANSDTLKDKEDKIKTRKQAGIYCIVY